MNAVEEAVAAIRAGKTVVLPFDTVYGLAADPHRPEPTERLYRLKGREPTQASAIVAVDIDQLLDCVPELHGRSATIARALLPGPYTLVLPNPARRFRWLTGSNEEAIGVRVPELHGPGAEVLARVGAVVATSANLAGGSDPRRPDEVPEALRAGVAVLVDGGELGGEPSTVIDFTGEEPSILRAGAGDPAEALRRLESAVRSS